MERDNDPALSSNEWLKHLAKEKRDWTTHREAAKGELLYAQQKTKEDVIAKETEVDAMETEQQEDDVPEPVIPPDGDAKSEMSTSQDRVNGKVEREITESSKPSKTSQVKTEESNKSSEADLDVELAKSNGDPEIQTSSEPTHNISLGNQATGNMNSHVPQILLVPATQDQHGKDEQLQEGTKQSQGHKTEIPPDSEIKMIDDDAASVTSSESSAMPDLVPVTTTIASNEQKQQPLDVEVKVITEAPRPSSEVATTTAPAMPRIKEESREAIQ